MKCIKRIIDWLPSAARIDLCVHVPVSFPALCTTFESFALQWKRKYCMSCAFYQNKCPFFTKGVSTVKPLYMNVNCTFRWGLMCPQLRMYSIRKSCNSPGGPEHWLIFMVSRLPKWFWLLIRWTEYHWCNRLTSQAAVSAWYGKILLKSSKYQARYVSRLCSIFAAFLSRVRADSIAN